LVIRREREKLGNDGERERGTESSNSVKRDLRPNINESFSTD